jgi:hypothetical protein
MKGLHGFEIIKKGLERWTIKSGGKIELLSSNNLYEEQRIEHEQEILYAHGRILAWI